MRIGVDAGCLGVKDERLKVGVYQVVKHLFHEIGKIDKENIYLLYSFYPIDKATLDSFGDNIRNIIVKPSKGWMKLWLPVRLFHDKVDIFLGTSQALPSSIPFIKYKKISIFYDLAFEFHPDFYNDSYKKLHDLSYSASRNSDKIISISNKTKNDLINTYQIKKNKIIVSYLAADRDFFNPSIKSEDSKLKKYAPYFLYVGALKKSKNIKTILSSFVLFSKKSKITHILLLVGGDKWLDPEIKQVMTDMDQETKKNIIFLGHVPDTTLVSLYKNATALVSPSFYEGFGLPMIEAAASGCPVISSTDGVVPEIMRAAALLYNPKDVIGISEGMLRIATDKKLGSNMKKKGIELAKTFSWEKFASDVFDEINKS